MSDAKFVWHDLLTSDVDGAKRFYGELLGWQFKKDAKDPYTLILLGGQDIGGMMSLAEIGATGVPPNWVGYISTKNLDATLASIDKYGGRLVMPKRSIEHVGTFAVAADPQGAVFQPFQYGGLAPKPETNERPAPSTFCWDELTTSDPAAAAKFYAAVYGWGVETVDIAGMTYTLLKRTGVKDEMGADKNAAGVAGMPPDAQFPPAWQAYVAVADADATAARVKTLGGAVLMEPMDIPNVGRFFPSADPQGAAISFLGPNKK
jgi:predicted enzyme related to lactoylglutathione lyase